MASGGMTSTVPGTPRWAELTAWAAVASVVPSAIWRTLVGVGVPLGWSDEHLELERIPGWGTLDVIALSVLSIGAAALTWGLVKQWGDRFPTWLVATLSVVGAAAVVWIIVQSIVHWSSVSGFADRPRSGWALLMVACYVPVALWPVVLLATLAAFLQRRARPAP